MSENKPAYVTPGHPVKAGAGYDCNCGQCLSARRQTEKPITPMWEAMDCPDVTDDPFYADFDAEKP